MAGHGIAPCATSGRHAHYGHCWGVGAARCFSLEEDFLDEDGAVRLMPVPDSFTCPISSAVMADPVATVDGCVYEREYIERWFRERRQGGHPITSPTTGLELLSATLMPLIALQKAIEAYLSHRPELLRSQSAGRSFEEAAQILQTDLFEKQAVHHSTQEKLRLLQDANKAIVRQLSDEQAAHADTRCQLRDLLLSSRSRSEHTLLREEHCMAEVLLPKQASPLSPTVHATAAPGVVARADVARQSKLASHQGLELGALPLIVVLVLLLVLHLHRPGEEQHGGIQLLLARALLPSVIMSSALGERIENHTWSDGAVALNSEALSSSSQLSHFARQLEQNVPFARQLEQLRRGNSVEKKQAAFDLRNLAADNAENQAAIVRAGAILPLVECLQDDASTVREEAARALWNLARSNREMNLDNQATIVRSGAVVPLVRLLRDAEPRVRVVSAAVLNDLATDNSENRVAIVRAGAVPPLVLLLREDEAAALFMAATLLQSLSATRCEPQVGEALTAAVEPLVELLGSQSSELAQEKATSILGALAACSGEIRRAVAHAGAITLLVKRLEGDMLQGTAALALGNLAADSAENQAAIAQAGAIPHLVKLLEDGMPGVRDVAARALWNVAMDNVDNQLAIIRAEAVIQMISLLKGEPQEQATVAFSKLQSSTCQ